MENKMETTVLSCIISSLGFRIGPSRGLVSRLTNGITGGYYVNVAYRPSSSCPSLVFLLRTLFRGLFLCTGWRFRV